MLLEESKNKSSFTFVEDQKTLLLEELVSINEQALDFKDSNLFFYNRETKGQKNTGKESFWLNIYNYLTLFKLAEMALLQPKLINELTSYAAWQAFFESNYFLIKGTRISQYDILHSILRQN